MKAKITSSTVEQAKPNPDGGSPATLLIWDTEVKGFGLRVTPNGIKSYILQYTAGKNRKAPKRRYTIGRHGGPRPTNLGGGTWTPDNARKEAIRLRGEIGSGNDPAKNLKELRRAPTFSDLVDDYVKNILDKRDNKQEGRRHLKWFEKQIGYIPLRDLDNVAIGRLRDKLEIEQSPRRRGDHKVRKAGTVNRYLGSLSSALTYAARELNWIDQNPMLGKRVRRLAEPRGRVRFLSDDIFKKDKKGNQVLSKSGKPVVVEKGERTRLLDEVVPKKWTVG